MKAESVRQGIAVGMLILVLGMVKDPLLARGEGTKMFIVDGTPVPVECSEGPWCAAVPGFGPAEWLTCRPTKVNETQCIPELENPCLCSKIIYSLQGITHTFSHDDGTKYNALSFCCNTFTATKTTMQTEPPPLGCSPKVPLCGDGILDMGEQCETRFWYINNVFMHGAYCLSMNATFNPTLLPCVACQCVTASCGDGIVQAGELCEPPNGVIGQFFCTWNCQMVPLGFCGDGVPGNSLGEECDPPQNGVCGNDCRLIPPNCGDGMVQAGEFCDWNGNQGGCSLLGQLCNKECNGCQPSPLCGNGMMNPGEGCDDGNTTDGDGCSSACQVEGADCANTLGYGYRDDPCASTECQETTSFSTPGGSEKTCYRCAPPTFTCCSEISGAPGTFAAFAGGPPCVGGCTVKKLNCEPTCPPGYNDVPPNQDVHCCQHSQLTSCTETTCDGSLISGGAELGEYCVAGVDCAAGTLETKKSCDCNDANGCQTVAPHLIPA